MTDGQPQSPVADDDAISLWVVEDDDFLRAALSALLDGSSGIACRKSFSNCEDALSAFVTSEPPEAVLMDIGLPGMDGIEGLRRIKRISPATDVIVLTNHEDDDKVFRAICGGANGYLVKSSSAEENVNAIKDVLTGGPPMNAQIARKVLYLFNKFAAPVQDYRLTPRETQALELLVQGFSKKMIDEQLNLSHTTIDTHFKSIYRKLEVHSSSEAVAKWMQANPTFKAFK